MEAKTETDRYTLPMSAMKKQWRIARSCVYFFGWAGAWPPRGCFLRWASWRKFVIRGTADRAPLRRLIFTDSIMACCVNAGPLTAFTILRYGIRASGVPGVDWAKEEASWVRRCWFG